MNTKWVARMVLLALLVFGTAACGRPTPETPSPTPPGRPADTPAPRGAADLSAERTRVECRHPGQVAEDVPVGDHEPVGTGDQINTDQSGRGILTFADFLRVEVFRKTRLQVKAAPDPNAPPIVKLYLALGTTLQQLQRKANQRVDVTTDSDWATIRAVATTYLISVDDDEVTWVVVFDGEVAVEAQEQTVVVRAGQATWVEPGRLPHAPIDVDLGATGEWVDRLRGTGEVGPIRPVIVPPEEEDHTDPWLEVWHSPERPDETQEVTVGAEAGDDVSGLDRIEIEMPGRPLVTCRASPCEATGGPYSVGEFDYDVWAFDKAGNTTHQVGSIAVAPREEEDHMDPWLEVWHWPERADETQEITVGAEAGDDGSGLDRIEIEMPGQPLVTCAASPCEATGGPYSVGEFGYEVRAFDRAGNMAYREGSIAVAPREEEDHVDPWLEVWHSPSEPNEEERVSVFAEAGDNESGLDRIEIEMPGQPLVTCAASPCEATGGPYFVGEFGYEVWAFDRAGNVTYREGQFVVAAIPVQDNPPVVEGNHVEPSTLYQGDEFRIRLVASDDFGVQSIRWWSEGTGDDYFDYGDEATCGGITWCELNWSLEWTGMDGEFTFYAQARDTAGQLSSVESTTINVLTSAARFSLLIGGGPFSSDEWVQDALGFAIDWSALREEIGEVVLVDFLSGETLAGPTEPAYSPDRAKALLEEVGYYGFDTMLLFVPDDELAAVLAEWVAGYLYEVEIYLESAWVDPADARARLTTMIEAGESGLLVERR
jgi:nuclear transport factor 2 (NTF2) superfamily protein